MSPSRDSFKSRKTITAHGKTYTVASLRALEDQGVGHVGRLPYSMKILLENLLRNEDGVTVTKEDIHAVAGWVAEVASEHEIAFRPSRVVLQDFTGVPAVVDLAAMREAIVKLGGSADKINPLEPVDLVIDHSVQVDYFGSQDALARNIAREFERNGERYTFLRWGQKAFDNFRVVPPGTGIVHQVNLEYLAKCVWESTKGGVHWAYPDTLVGTDSHTTMINGLGVLGWGVGGIEAEAAMLGQPIAMLVPQVVGFRLTGAAGPGVTATDVVLRVVEMLRAKGVVGKFVEFYGPCLENLPLADRATIANMAPEYGATMGFFPVDAVTLDYLRFSGRSDETVALTEAYCKEQGLFWTPDAVEPVFSSTLELDLATVEPSIAGPKRPQDRIALSKAKEAFATVVDTMAATSKFASADVTLGSETFTLEHGDVVIAAITSCTNTSNPSVMVGAGLIAKKAAARGLTRKPWVKTSLAPGSKVVTEYLRAANLLTELEKLGFDLVGYGCTTCIGNSGPLPEPISAGIREANLIATSVLSGNRNFEGRINPDVRANYLASPPLVVAYAIAGTMDFDIVREPLGTDPSGQPVYLADIWPSNEEIRETLRAAAHRSQFLAQYANVFDGDLEWQSIEVTASQLYAWDPASTYIKRPPFFDGMAAEPAALTDITGARVLALLGDSVTTDHISPAGSIPKGGPAGRYLIANGVDPRDFNSFGARRGNHEVMMRGTFANIRLRNKLVPGVEGGYTRYLPDGSQMDIYDASMKYQAAGVPLIVIAGKEYGTGSSRDWAAKGTALLGVRAVIAESFERIHRSNLVGMGVLPLQFTGGITPDSLGLTGEEVLSIGGIAEGLEPGVVLEVKAVRPDGSEVRFDALCRIDTPIEVDYYRHGGILHYVLRQLARG
jgi:aconitate hydratase